MEYETFYVTFMSTNFGIIFVIVLAACLCCKRKIPKNEFLGLEGMVKIKNLEESIEQLQQIEPNSSTTEDIDLKRASNAPHRSLPDIPVVETLNDNGSELYATVADKVNDKPQGRSPAPNLKKQTSVSQHSSISQTDDVSSPYARVKTPPHDYDKVLSTEHPYAQLNAPGQQNISNPNIENIEVNQISRHESNQSLINALEQQQQQQQEIPAASAIAGMVSASQELPYMTPPIVQQPHFSGDSQDSSKGYTSISVREPLANIIAQTNRLPPPQARLLHRNGSDSHYATVSDDSDEMYAAIDDPNNVYTSGSETYAQIEPSNAQITVSVEINSTPSRGQEQIDQSHIYEMSKVKNTINTPVPPPVDSLRAQMHSRQTSSSSNTSSVGILGSPKPEKRQANSPLPPTPKNSQSITSSNLTPSSSVPSSSIQSKGNVSAEFNDNSIVKNFFSPSKDIEGMYAKVVKKNKFVNTSSQNSPVMGRKLSIETNSPDMVLLTSDLNIKDYVLNAIQASPGKNSVKSASYLDNSYETIDKRRPRCNSYDNKDHGYETIPGNQINNVNNNKYELFVPNILENNIQSSEAGYESLPHQSQNSVDPRYETFLKTTKVEEIVKQVATTTSSDYDPNYEVLRPSVAGYSGSSDDGYARVAEKVSSNNEDNMIDGYSRVKDKDDDNIPGYSKISESNGIKTAVRNHDYASILEAKNRNKCALYQDQRKKNDDINQFNLNNNYEGGSEIYSSIPNKVNRFINLNFSEEFHNYQTIYDIQTSLPTENTSAITTGLSTAVSKTTTTTTSTISNNIIGCYSTKLSETLPIPTSVTTTPSAGKNSPLTDNQHNETYYNNMKSSCTSNTLSSNIPQNSSSNYESITSIESDPNYESVRYLNANENPYERLRHSDSNMSSDILQLQSSPSSSIETEATVLLMNSTGSKDISEITAKTITTIITQNSLNSINNENDEVADYFQV